VRGHADNIKVTNPEDAALAAAILLARAASMEETGETTA
jgi:2-C-methyl-D-erythritol 4-phosphate cytidylyltransferase